jgi:hypothetical protein
MLSKNFPKVDFYNRKGKVYRLLDLFLLKPKFEEFQEHQCHLSKQI